MANVPRAHAVIWQDAHLNGLDEADASDCVHRAWHYTTCGILVRSDESGVTLAMDQGEDGKYRTRTFIPRVLVVDEWSLGPIKKKAPRKKTPVKQEEPPNN